MKNVNDYLKAADESLAKAQDAAGRGNNSAAVWLVSVAQVNAYAALAAVQRDA